MYQFKKISGFSFCQFKDVYKRQELALKYYDNAVNSLDGERQIVFDCGYSGSVSSGLMPVCKNKVIRCV